MRRDSLVGLAAAASAGIIWGFLGPVVRGLIDLGISPMQMSCIRYIIVFAILIVYVAVFDRDSLKTGRKALAVMVMMGVVGTFLNSTCYFEAMGRISLSLSTVLQYIAPFIVVAMSYPLFGERITPVKAVAVCTAFIGCILCTGALTSPGDLDIIGISLAALSGLFFGMYTLGSKGLSRSGLSSTTILLYSSLFCVIASAPFCGLPSALGTLASSWEAAGMMLVLGVLITLLPFWLFNYALQKADASKVSIVTFIEPLTATAVGLAVFGEAVDTGTAVGMAMILVSLVAVNGFGRRGDQGPSDA